MDKGISRFPAMKIFSANRQINTVKTNSGYYFGNIKQRNGRVISLENEVSTWNSGRKECKTAAVVRKNVVDDYQGTWI